MEKFADRLKQFHTEFQENEEVMIREFKGAKQKMAVIFLTTFCTLPDIATQIIKPIMETNDEKVEHSIIEHVRKNVVINAQAKIIETFDEAVTGIATGSCILIIDGEQKFLEIPAKKVEKRAITEPPTNSVIHGPRQGFIEDIDTNLALLRARMPTSKLKIKKITVGSVTKTKVAVVSITGIADKQVCKNIVDKISEIEIDGIIDSYYIEEFLKEKPNSIFKQAGTTEKPDILTAKLLEGRVGIIVDGSPIVLTLPFILLEDIQSSEDYFDEKTKATFVRLIRAVGVVVATILPGLYIAFQLFHYKALPLKFLVTIVNAGQSIPLSPALEVLFTFFLFEILYEASVRIPKGLGSSFNIIGALILGDTAVKSNLASAPTVMVIALSSIAIYLLPDETSVLRIIRIGFTLLGATMGVIGIVIGMIFVIVYLCDFDSYGAAYLGPYAPRIKNDLKDGFIKQNLRQMKTLPKSFPTDKKKRKVGKKDEE